MVIVIFKSTLSNTGGQLKEIDSLNTLESIMFECLEYCKKEVNYYPLKFKYNEKDYMTSDILDYWISKKWIGEKERQEMTKMDNFLQNYSIPLN